MVRKIIVTSFAAMLLVGCMHKNSEGTDMKHSDMATTKPMTMYTCTMHPQVSSDKAGKCPVCGMALVAKH